MHAGGPHRSPTIPCQRIRDVSRRSTVHPQGFSRQWLGVAHRQGRGPRQFPAHVASRRGTVPRHHRLREHRHSRDQPGPVRRPRHALSRREGPGQEPADALLVRFLDDGIPYLDHPRCPVHEDPTDPITGRQASAGRHCPRTRAASPGGRGRSATPSGWHRAPSSPTSSARSTRPSWRPAPACPPRRRCTSG